MTVPTTPTGYHSVTPYMSVSDANRLIDFMVEAFGAEVVLTPEQAAKLKEEMEKRRAARLQKQG